jgi:hypothetical protein
MSTIELLRLNTRVCVTNPVWPHIRKTSVAHLTTRYTCTAPGARTAEVVAVKSDDPHINTVVTLTHSPADLSADERDALLAHLTHDLSEDPANLGPVCFDPTFFDGHPVVTTVALGG